MMPPVWGVQWQLALTRKRVFILNFVVPFTLVLPIATGAVPTGAAAGIYVVLFTAFAMFGSAVTLRWEGQRGMSARIVRAGIAPSSYLLQRAGAGARHQGWRRSRLADHLWRRGSLRRPPRHRSGLE